MDSEQAGRGKELDLARNESMSRSSAALRSALVAGLGVIYLLFPVAGLTAAKIPTIAKQFGACGVYGAW